MEYSKALYMMGYCYYNGIVVMKDENQALDYFKKAAQFGYKEAEERVHDILLSRETQNYDDVPF